MTAKKIYLVRHGQTDYNLQGIVQGRTIDSSLNDTGKKQALSFWKAFKDVPFQKIYTSSLKRTGESIQEFIDLGISTEKESGLDEISWGDYDGKKIFEDDYYWDVVKEWNAGNVSLRIKGGESPEDVRNRQLPVIEKIANSEEDLVLVCMHGRAMRILLSHFIDGNLNSMDNYEHKNLGLYVLELDDNGLKILQENVVSHLD